MEMLCVLVLRRDWPQFLHSGPHPFSSFMQARFKCAVMRLAIAQQIHWTLICWSYPAKELEYFLENSKLNKCLGLSYNITNREKFNIFIYLVKTIFLDLTAFLNDFTMLQYQETMELQRHSFTISFFLTLDSLQSVLTGPLKQGSADNDSWARKTVHFTTAYSRNQCIMQCLVKQLT